MDFVWIAALAVFWLGMVGMVNGLHALQSDKREKNQQGVRK
jgi:hypothetical protein